MGLPESSRVKKKISGQKLTLEQALLALILDDFNLLWSRSKRKGSRPKSIYKMLTEDKKQKDDLMSFKSTEDFDKWLKRKQERGNG